MHAIGAETWIMHGTLLGWWWNRRIMPWDSDADVMVSERAMAFLASYYNMTVHSFDVPELPRPRKRYLLEVNPHYVNASTNDWMNVIDARWIDTENGLFIDITTLRPDLAAQERGERGMLMSKDRHRYREKDLFPLRDSYFEDTPVKVPFGYAELLEEEYGSKALVQTNYKNHQFDRERQEWLPM
ncbi:hypothetical protein BDY21DRAFT_342480 [Lineolata rhizophorae]|uniref:LicD/FKTN/FKRP nucleotidyltransferase domain-containing protein n=1 Tax=Lineolata rhizophorae TaxID=578093 RepID=A0A6A6P3Q9_9PEZI|nr:hypothetical protein BDY21DRAFT_342480 [Lineolata rhizophorae]